MRSACWPCLSSQRLPHCTNCYLASPPSDPHLAGVVYPKDGPTNKETGRRCERFGPLESFTLDLSDKKVVQVRRMAAGRLDMLAPTEGQRARFVRAARVVA